MKMRDKLNIQYSLAVDALRTLIERVGIDTATGAYEEAMSDANYKLKLLNVDGTTVPAVSRTFHGFGDLTIEIGTQAGNDDGDVTVIVLKPTSSFVCRASFGTEQSQTEIGESGDADSIRLVVQGHCERYQLSQAFCFIANLLRGNE
jgi:hypothetical protein